MSNSNQTQDHQGFGQILIPQFTKQSVCPVTFFKLAHIYLCQQNKQTQKKKQNTHTTWQTVVLQVCSVSKYTVLGESAQTRGDGSLPTITTTDFRGHLTQSVSVLFWGTGRTKIYPQKWILFIMTSQFTKRRPVICWFLENTLTWRPGRLYLSENGFLRQLHPSKSNSTFNCT